MQDIENDMDDLFKRAAEEYPLHVGESNWESIEKKIAVPPIVSESQPGEKKNNKRLFPFLLLTGILLLIGLVLFSPHVNNHQTGKSSNSANQHNVPDNKISEQLQASNHTAHLDIKKESASIDGMPEENKIKSARSFATEKENLFPKKNSLKITSHKYQKANSAHDQKEINADTIVNKKYFDKEKEEKEKLLTDNKSSGYKTDSSLTQKNVISTANKKTKSNIKPPKENGFYAGIIVGTDYSKVKSASFKEPGFSAGVLIGYKTKSFFTETGISISHKYYSSQGNMFDDQDGSMPSGMIIDNLESHSKILEIPLKAGYYFYKKKNTNLFIAGGAALYIMTREKNNYNVTMNGNPEKMVGLYEKNSLKIPAVFSISAGWEHYLSGRLKIRIEPVLKLPLQGIGVGRLPVTSAGIQIGIMRQLK